MASATMSALNTVASARVTRAVKVSPPSDSTRGRRGPRRLFTAGLSACRARLIRRAAPQVAPAARSAFSGAAVAPARAAGFAGAKLAARAPRAARRAAVAAQAKVRC